jgi:uncharacterized protein YfaQ (DUF2300 family)
VSAATVALVLLANAGTPAGPPAVTPDLAVAWLQDGRVETRQASPAALTEGVPLGSLWKLFVFAYAVDRGVETPDYRCATPLRNDEEYCCAAGQTVSRDRALARSCGPFFQPSRLGIEASAWQAYWRGRTSPEGAWTTDLDRLQPDTRLDVPMILAALAGIPETARHAAARALLPVAVETPGALAELGGALRVKTFTWKHPGRAGQSLGGGAGWLVDGTPVWFGATGGSREVMRRDAHRIAELLPRARESRLTDACVRVDYFERYPIRAVDRMPSREPAGLGPLHGAHRVLFENGNALTFTSAGELRLLRDEGRLRVQGRLRMAEYLARVLDREADPGATEAARALAVVARTWVAQNAPFGSGCFQVEDSTRMQRVSASPASTAARAVAAFTEGLVLRGENVRYQLEGAAPGVLSWNEALRESRQGRRFDAILAQAFPRAALAAESGEVECRRLPDVEAWLAREVPRWRQRLAAEPGFEAPAQSLTACALDAGNPYSDRQGLRVHVRGLQTAEDRITLAHEWVHLAFRYHPRGTDEADVERLARLLAGE